MDDVTRQREERIEAAVTVLGPFISYDHADTMRACLRAVYHGGTVDIEARVDGEIYRWEADWVKYLPEAIAQKEPET